MMDDIKVLTRGERGVIAGVCSGLANYYNLRKNGLRMAFVLTSFLLGVPLLLYIVLWMILPRYPSTRAMLRQLRRKAGRQV